MGAAGLNAVAPSDDCPLLELRVDEAAALGLLRAPANSRLLAHASIAADELEKKGNFDVAAQKTLAGPSILSLGAQPDSISCPEAKQRALVSQAEAFVDDVAVGTPLNRVQVERFVGRLNAISQFFPEVAAELAGGYRVASARTRQPPRRLLPEVPVSATSTTGRGFTRTCLTYRDRPALC